jgi:hypothetical protein
MKPASALYLLDSELPPPPATTELSGKAEPGRPESTFSYNAVA